MLGHKTSLNKVKKIKIISNIFHNHNGMKLEVNYKKKTGKTVNTQRLNMLLNNYWVIEKNQKINQNIPSNK